MREWTKGIVKKITLEVIYDIVDERTRDIYRKLEKIEERQESDFKYLNQKIDQLNQKVDIQIGQLRQEMKEDVGQFRQEMNQLRQEVKEEISQLRQEVKEEVGNLKKDIDRINQRIDVLIQMVANLQK